MTFWNAPRRPVFSFFPLYLVLGCVFVTHNAFAREVRDVTGVSVTLVDAPQRIVTLAPSLAELAADLAGEHLERIVGVSEFTDYPPSLATRPSIGSYARFNLEKVVDLRPDLVLATQDGNPRDQVLHLRELKIPVVVVSTESLDGVARSMSLVAEAMGAQKKGEQMSEALRTGIRKIRERVQARKGVPPRVLLQVGDDPLVVAGPRSFLHEVLETIGARNVIPSAAGTTATRYPRPSLESVMAGDPDFILVMDLGHNPKLFQQMAAKWNRFPKLLAVRKQRVKVVHGDSILRPSLRLLEGLTILERALYGK